VDFLNKDRKFVTHVYRRVVGGIEERVRRTEFEVARKMDMGK